MEQDEGVSDERVGEGSSTGEAQGSHNPGDLKTRLVTRLARSTWFVVAALVFIFPLGLYLMWRYMRWSKVAKVLVSALVATLLVLLVTIDDPAPEVEFVEPIGGVAEVERSHFVVKVRVKGSTKGVNVKIANQQAVKDGNTFSLPVKLKEGINRIRLTATRGEATSTRELDIVRLMTQAEVDALKEKTAEQARKREESRLAKEKEEADKAEQERLAREKVEADKRAREEEEEARAKAEEAARNAPKTTFGSGTFLVNSEIVPGRYKSAGGSMCYFERLRGTSGEFRDIISNEIPSGQAIVTIAKSDVAFQSSGCGEWTKVG